MRDLEWNRALLMTALISGADVSMSALEPQEDILIFIVTYFSQNIINCNKLSQILLLNETFVSDCQ